MSLCECLQTHADAVELIDFAQDRLKRHGHTALSLKQSKVVKSLSPHRRIVIAFRSPKGVFETGLLGWLPERMAAKPAGSIEQDTFSGPVSEQELRNCAHFLQFPEPSCRISLHCRLCGGAGSLAPNCSPPKFPKQGK
jgi:hypothetical protein